MHCLGGLTHIMIDSQPEADDTARLPLKWGKYGFPMKQGPTYKFLPLPQNLLFIQTTLLIARIAVDQLMSQKIGTKRGKSLKYLLTQKLCVTTDRSSGKSCTSAFHNKIGDFY